MRPREDGQPEGRQARGRGDHPGGQHHREAVRAGDARTDQQADRDGVETDQVEDFSGPCESNDIDFTGLGPKETQDVTVAFAVPERGRKLAFEIWPEMDDDPFKVSGVL